ncbi:dihydrodipicolinate synthase family protein [Lipingzhangella sp. LS1_29]|uniref:Dihydrodipicolinate synthase family protein n=1 Tax=Lipingzhangella rawalii TaxID=2055835 RepID=A0ABU2H750_9ACTN|nr:dihydrodipicolinate synthase family protein [Lipingzhangella rawalii]MDS1271139.1 dihydrodipicolinate synthase family protein [Lipingzhangella rawalii]
MPDAAWHGVLVATTVPFTPQLEVDLDRYADQVRWLAENGCDGVVPNGSLGEYQTLTDTERAAVVRTAVAAAPPGFTVVPGVAAYGAAEARRWAEQAEQAGCPAVMLLPPNAYRAEERSVLEHYAAVAEVGLPVVAYNNPVDTKVDLTPELLARLHAEGLIVAVKEFSQDVRRAYQIVEQAPELDLLVGADDVLVELVMAGASGWISGYTNVFPRSCVELYHACRRGDLERALPLYRTLHPALRWDTTTEFVQAIKYSMDLVGRHGGPCRPPRTPLEPHTERTVRHATQDAAARGCV